MDSYAFCMHFFNLAVPQIYIYNYPDKTALGYLGYALRPEAMALRFELLIFASLPNKNEKQNFN